MATHSSILVGKNSMDRGAYWAVAHGVAKGRTQLMQLAMHITCLVKKCSITLHSETHLAEMVLMNNETSNAGGDLRSEK